MRINLPDASRLPTSTFPKPLDIRARKRFIYYVHRRYIIVYIYGNFRRI